MLRRLAVASVALLVVACGDSNSGAPAPGPAQGVSGTIMGQPFTAVDSSAVVLSQATCPVGGVSATATGLALGFSSAPGLCAFVTQNQLCGVKANATVVTLAVVRANVLGGSPGPVQPGTYTISGTTPIPDLQGNVTVAEAQLTKTDSSCRAPGSLPTVTGGTVRITAVGARTSGSVDVTFSDGGRISGSFDVANCGGLQLDVCSALSGGNCPATPPCIQ